MLPEEKVLRLRRQPTTHHQVVLGLPDQERIIDKFHREPLDAGRTEKALQLGVILVVGEIRHEEPVRVVGNSGFAYFAVQNPLGHSYLNIVQEVVGFPGLSGGGPNDRYLVHAVVTSPGARDGQMVLGGGSRCAHN
jgi:hypothetical protein